MASLSRAPGDLPAAVAAFRALPVPDQRRLAYELATTRRGELTRAYADVVGVASGYRLRTRARGARRIEPEVCVAVVVKRKRPRVAAGRRVPEYLFAYWSVDGERVLCAVPTDVEDARQLARIRPQGRIEAVAGAPPRFLPGTVACAVTRDDDASIYAIGCRHVLGMALLLDPAQDHNAEIRAQGDAVALGRATPIGGRLENGLEWSFDSQLARVVAPDALRAVLDGVTFSDRATGWADLAGGVDYWVLTSHGPVRARYAGHYPHPLHYTARLHDVRHWDLAKFLLPDKATFGGDSGSPVATTTSGGTLLGMLIAGDAVNLAVVIPAWQLFHAPWYGLGGETWHFWPRL